MTGDSPGATCAKRRSRKVPYTTLCHLSTIAMAQSRPIMRFGKSRNEFCKILFIVDMNSAVDDVANQIVRLYQELGRKKKMTSQRWRDIDSCCPRSPRCRRNSMS
ncbi:hypothetical protein QC762_305113 [Podospora pseudocomata]|uniref:Uncharacterized protein n=1 Tax=Podospora pseudocomata TaxID=2093779 RepID=A0ABR0GJ43_9PEZI|nr:hypothetical protein QC762_305113 [Podospora pseudocomata]